MPIPAEEHPEVRGVEVDAQTHCAHYRWAADAVAIKVMARRALLWLELLALFGGIPLLIYKRLLPNLPILYLLVMALGAFIYLRRSSGFRPGLWWNATAARQRLAPLLIRDVVLIAILGIAVWLSRPELLWLLLRRSPLLWAAIMVLYPILSVYPQEILFRAFFFHRYAPLFGNGVAMIAASAVVFGFAHVIFGSWTSVALSTMGGVLFAVTYRNSGSLLLACTEHALFGDFIFTIGLGQFFYHGAGR